MVDRGERSEGRRGQGLCGQLAAAQSVLVPDEDGYCVRLSFSALRLGDTDDPNNYKQRHKLSQCLTESTESQTVARVRLMIILQMVQ